jgi:AraC-like DNA-binding protein
MIKRGDYVMEKQDVINKIQTYIDNHLSEELNLNQLAVLAGYSKFHMCRIFSEFTGMTVHQYIQKGRMTEAARQLAQTNLTISDIAAAYGYEYQQSFQQAFKKLYLETPLSYRRRHQYQTLIINQKKKLTNKLPYDNQLQKKRGALAA